MAAMVTTVGAEGGADGRSGRSGRAAGRETDDIQRHSMADGYWVPTLARRPGRIKT